MIGGIVLCGGQSKRMGRPKAWLPIGNELMLQRIVRLLSTVVDPVVVVAAAEQSVPELPAQVRIVRDEQESRGPLQGLAAGLASLKGQVDAVFLSSCDAPFLLPAFVQRIIQLSGAHALCVPYVRDRHHPLTAVYRVDVLDTVRRLLMGNCLRLGALIDEVPTRIVTAAELVDVDPGLQSLQNLNTPAEYALVLENRLASPHSFDL